MIGEWGSVELLMSGQEPAEEAVRRGGGGSELVDVPIDSVGAGLAGAARPIAHGAHATFGNVDRVCVRGGPVSERVIVVLMSVRGGDVVHTKHSLQEFGHFGLFPDGRLGGGFPGKPVPGSSLRIVVVFSARGEAQAGPHGLELGDQVV